MEATAADDLNEERVSSSRRDPPWIGPAIALLVFALCLGLYTRHNDFPYFYHTDEPSKVRQIVQDTRNFFHPLLLLTGTELGMRISGRERTEQNAVEIGRLISAIFAAAAVAAFSLLAYHYGGLAAALAAGLFVGLYHQLYELAHYMKEDPALLVGTAACFLAYSTFWTRRTLWSVALVGASCGLAISGKYIGVIMLLIGLPLVLLAPQRGAGDRRYLRVVVFLGALVAVLLMINYRMLAEAAVFQRGLSREVAFIAEGHGGLGREVPHFGYFRSLRSSGYIPTLIALLAGAHLVYVGLTWRRRTPPEMVLALFPLAYTLMLSFSSKTADRYHLPAIAVICYLAAIGLVEMARLGREKVLLSGRIRWSTAIIVLGLIAGGAFQTRLLLIRQEGFATDHRRALVEHIRSSGTVPADAVVAEGMGVRMKLLETMNAGPLFPQTLRSYTWLSDFESLERLQAEGITHLAMNRSEYHRYLRRGVKPHPDVEEEFYRRKRFYEGLLERTEQIWFRRQGRSVLQPEIGLYALPVQTTDAPRTPSGMTSPALTVESSADAEAGEE